MSISIKNYASPASLEEICSALSRSSSKWSFFGTKCKILYVKTLSDGQIAVATARKYTQRGRRKELEEQGFICDRVKISRIIKTVFKTLAPLSEEPAAKKRAKAAQKALTAFQKRTGKVRFAPIEAPKEPSRKWNAVAQLNGNADTIRAVFRKFFPKNLPGWYAEAIDTAFAMALEKMSEQVAKKKITPAEASKQFWVAFDDEVESQTNPETVIGQVSDPEAENLKEHMEQFFNSRRPITISRRGNQWVSFDEEPRVPIHLSEKPAVIEGIFNIPLIAYFTKQIPIS